MANEITYNGELTIAKGGNIQAREQLKRSMSGSYATSNIQQMTGSAWTAVTFGSIGTPKYVFIQNQTTSSYAVAIARTGEADCLMNILPNDFAQFPASGSTIVAKVRTTTPEKVPLRVTATE